MVKPALPYLDIISEASRIAPDHPLACYQVSGEYAMIYAGAEAGVYDLRTMAFEACESMLRAGKSHIPPPRAPSFCSLLPLFPGATIILTYFTPQFLDWLDQ
jgi:porphobilinogen synthase